MLKNITENIVWRRFRKNQLAVYGGTVVIALFIVAMAAPFIVPYDPSAIDVASILRPPSFMHPLGTDDLGRDVLSRMMWGARISLAVGFVAVGIATILGVILGALAGYYRSWLESLIMRFADIMLAIPSFFLILTVIAFIGPSMWNIMVVIGVTSWMGVARLVRAEFLSLAEREFVLAAKSIGANNARIMLRHILPNALSPVYVYFILGIAGAILLESALSFLGLGVQPPVPSWGNILASGRENMEIAWWLVTFPGVAIFVTCLSYYLLGEGIREALDPKIK